MPISTADYASMLARTKRTPMEISEAIIRESELHDQIIAECKRRGWYIVHSRMDRRTTTAVGVPDFIIATDQGGTLWIEAKAKGGKVTLDQLAAHAWLSKLGHEVHVVRSIEEFLKI